MKTAPQYEPLIIKDYGCWTLFLSQKQEPYVGRCYAWYRDRTPGEGEGMRFSEIPDKALLDLKQIARDIERAWEALGHDTSSRHEFLDNVSKLGNEAVHNHHMHIHFVPRFKKPVGVEALLGRPFEDLVWGQNPASIRQFSWPLDDYLLLAVRDTMAAAIDGRP